MRACVPTVVVILASAIGIAAQAERSPVTVEAEVRAADTSMWEAVNACNPEKWNRIVADDMVLISIGGTSFDKQKLRDDFFATTLHPVPCDTEYTNEPMKVRVYGDAAVVTGNLSYKGNGKGRVRDLRFVFTRVYEKRQGAWQFVLGQHTAVKQRQNGPF